MRHWFPLAVLLAVAGEARGQQVDAPDHRANVRVGVSTGDDNGRPTICLDVAVAYGVAVEGCGTGSGFLHQDDGQEMAHFRAKWTAHERGWAGGTVRVQPGAGFAELEIGTDTPGFDFGDPGGPVTSVAGPEAAVSVQWIRSLGKGFELVGNVSAGAAYFGHADRLADPQDRLQPFVSLEVGAGW